MYYDKIYNRSTLQGVNYGYKRNAKNIRKKSRNYYQYMEVTLTFHQKRKKSQIYKQKQKSLIFGMIEIKLKKY